MKNKNGDILLQYWLVIAALLIFIAGSTLNCATLDKEEVLSIHDRMITLYMESVIFMESVALTDEQKIKLESMITRAEQIYKDMVEIYGQSSNIAARWDVLVATLKLIK